MRTFKLPPIEIGGSLALIQTLGAVGGVLLGGWLTDRWKLKSRRAPVRIAVAVLLCLTPAVLLMLLVRDFHVFLFAFFIVGILTALHMGGFHALIQELVLPRMRGSAAACQTLIGTVVIFGAGPYWAGKVSALTGSLSAGLLSLLALVPIALLVLWMLARRLDAVTPESRLATAIAAGEPMAPVDAPSQVSSSAY
jgi:MFS family permease